MKVCTGTVLSNFTDASLVEGFAKRELPVGVWNHRAHLVVAAHYLSSLPFEMAVDSIKTGIRECNERQGVANTSTSGYHETLTCFWIAVVRSELRVLPDSLAKDPVSAATCVANRLANQPSLWKQFYSYDIVRCATARMSWREPDLKPLPS
jgi:hypothetical protein